MSFRFTTIGDIRRGEDSTDGLYEQYKGTCRAIKTILGSEGDFHMTVGDVDVVEFNREGFSTVFGPEAIWIPVLGNHELTGSSYCDAIGTDVCIEWIRKEFDPGNNPSFRQSLQSQLDAVTGPDGAPETMWYFDKENIRFIICNFYWSGENVANADQGYTVASPSVNSNAEIRQAHLDWIEPLLIEAKETGLHVIMVGHEPFFDNGKKRGGGGFDSCLNRNKPTRDQMW